MPINNGSNIRTTTIIGKDAIDGDNIASHFYSQNQQREGRKPLTKAPGNATPLNTHPSREYVMPEEMEKALNEELATKGFTGKKRTRKTKTD